MLVIKYRKIFYALSIILIVGSLLSLSVFGLLPSIDFVGGSLLEVSFDGDLPSGEKISQTLEELNFKNSSVRSSEDGFIIRLKEISLNDKETIIQALSFGGKYFPVEKTFSTVGPTLGREAMQKSWISIALVLLAIVLFVAFAFRKVSKSIYSDVQIGSLSSWSYGLVTVLALLHDIIIPAGVFALLGQFYGFEVDALFVTALLVILGFSVHDSIVVFDRVRENLHKNEQYKEGKNFETVVGESINQTFVRSINTALTSLLAIFVLYLFGPETVRHFSLTLLIGLAAGTYSSIFFASPLLVTINNWKNRRG